MLATEIADLCKTFKSWSDGKPYPTLEAWLEFDRRLRALHARVAMLELGVDPSVIDIAAEAPAPDSRVVVLQPRKFRVIDGGAA
ncbi:hypothetical protein HU230_0008070 [Bradyrhizobium quebecense]|uniref:Uncharacterized protein n=1 Tax=Bradyrhizobium quebecense TaxID=2748629 RepID=A0A974ABI9_9BRAD|nr:hypothetical protein [Bradyrhizobium quebecense]UGA45983.1 hypothetical protein HU230_0008070 [Bradyrhizobium quebecense]